MYRKYTHDNLLPLVASVTTYSALCRAVGLHPATGSQTHLKNVVTKFGIDTSHFLGRSINKGKTFPSKRPLETYLIEGSTAKTDTIRRRLIKEGVLMSRCAFCGITEWDGEEAPLELDHINSIPDDFRLTNLQILCANCHALKTRRLRKIRRTK